MIPTVGVVERSVPVVVGVLAGVGTGVGSGGVIDGGSLYTSAGGAGREDSGMTS